jgi:chaperonin GroES
MIAAHWSVTVTVPYYVSEDKSDMRGIKPGWYAVEDDGDISSGPSSLAARNASKESLSRRMKRWRPSCNEAQIETLQPNRNLRRIPMKFRPLHDRVVVERIDPEAKSTGGIIIPDTAQEKPSQGEIIAVGPGGRDEAGKLIPIDLKVGDRVLFGKWSGTEVKLDGVDYLIMKESDIMGVLHEALAKKKAA